MMRFLWKSQLKKERGKFLPESGTGKKTVTRKERLRPHGSQFLLVGVIFLWLFFLGTVIYLAMFSPYLQFATWQADGLESVNEESFRQTVERELSQNYFGFIPRNTFFLMRPMALERLLRAQYPLIRDISVQRTFPNTLAFFVTERSTIILWCSSGECFQILEDGNTLPVTAVFGKGENQAQTLTLRDESNQPLPRRENVFENTFVPAIVALKDGLQTRFGIETGKEIKVVSRFASELRMKTIAGWEIYFSTRLAPEKSLSALGLLLGTEISKEQEGSLQYIDLRTENRVFYRYRDDALPKEVIAEETVTPEAAGKEKKKK